MHRDDQKKVAKELKEISDKLHRAREQARSFKQKEDKHHRSIENRKMVNYIANIQPMVKN